ncbi:Capsular polysaccharide biosynthesis protein-like [Synechococcus sp. CC9902]|uniref:glycosyltransferase family 61 protein n=1 Tax=Synechococcus sp. (strain CC9902) TaxID=316279 RepID=UPI00005D3CFC|nr:glycosyltransferase family 61 protein [Synechococcus sp. CC9902]ABB25074.1 Capsular polysaccharide biosynthesis protein-like [Synechococcus sp. CC9902]
MSNRNFSDLQIHINGRARDFKFYLERYILDKNIIQSKPDELIYEPTSLYSCYIHEVIVDKDTHGYFNKDGSLNRFSYPNRGIRIKNQKINKHKKCIREITNKEIMEIDDDCHNIILMNHVDHFNYWHWTFDCLTKLIIAKKLGIVKISKLRLYVIGYTELKNFQWDGLDLIGIKRSQVIFSNRKVKFKKLLNISLPSPISNSKEVIKLVKSALDQQLGLSGLSNIEKVQNGKVGEKLFIKRGNAKNNRTIDNIEEVKLLCIDKGYSVIDPGEMSLLEQIEVFRKSTKVVGVHGSAFVNMLYMKSGSVIELFTKEYCPLHEFALAKHCSLDYKIIESDVNNRIDLKKLENLL